MMYDVVVVGAGPAGSTAAKVLREKGVNVLLVDKASFPREKACGGGMPTRVWKRFPFIESHLDSLSYGTTMYSMSQRYKLRVLRESPFLGMVIRPEFDALLLRRAVEAGVEFRQAVVEDMQVQADRVVLSLVSGETLEARVVVGCDGYNSLVARKAGLSNPEALRCVCLVAEHPMAEAAVEALYSKQRPVHLFIKAQGIAGYGWVFPKKSCVNVGLGEFTSAVQGSGDRRGLKESFSLFVENLRQQGLLPEDFSEGEAKGAVLPVFPLKRTYADRVVVCGDAAGFINPITGEGIYFAMASGEDAAGVVAEALRVGDCSARFLSRYQRRWWKDFGRDLKVLGGFNGQWGKNSEQLVRLLIRDKKLAKMTLGVTGGQISIARYLWLLYARVLYVMVKEAVSPSKDA